MSLFIYLHDVRGQRTTLWNWFSPSTFPWVPRAELRSLGLCGKCPSLRNHLACPGHLNVSLHFFLLLFLIICVCMCGVGIYAHVCRHPQKPEVSVPWCLHEGPGVCELPGGCLSGIFSSPAWACGHSDANKYTDTYIN